MRLVETNNGQEIASEACTQYTVHMFYVQGLPTEKGYDFLFNFFSEWENKERPFLGVRLMIFAMVFEAVGSFKIYISGSLTVIE